MLIFINNNEINSLIIVVISMLLSYMRCSQAFVIKTRSVDYNHFSCFRRSMHGAGCYQLFDHQNKLDFSNNHKRNTKTRRKCYNGFDRDSLRRRTFSYKKGSSDVDEITKRNRSRLSLLSSSSLSPRGASILSNNELQLSKSKEEQRNAKIFDNRQEDTIYALSSGSSSNQATAVAVIRISGVDALQCLQQMLPRKGEKRNFPPKARYATLYKLYHPISKQPLDHALILYFPAPHSYSGEDIIELHCHGSRAVVSSVLKVLSNMNSFIDNDSKNDISIAGNNSDGDGNDAKRRIRAAEPGEFTQRAYTNAKLDLLQIEALADLLTSDTTRQAEQALKQLDGKLSKKYLAWRSTLISGLAHAEAIIDFGDDEQVSLEDDMDDYFDEDDEKADDSANNGSENVWGGVIDKIGSLETTILRHTKDNKKGEIIRLGIQISIIGPPNAGKSSLFNLLAQRDIAIVSDTAGTTRDVLEMSLNLHGIKCVISDTAGIRSSTSDTIEQEGIKRTYKTAKNANIIVIMIDRADISPSDDEYSSDDYEKIISKNIQNILNEILVNDFTTDTDISSIKSGKILLVLNKSDLNDKSTSSDTHNILKHSKGLEKIVRYSIINNNKENNAENCNSNNILQKIGGIYEISCKTNEGIESFLENLSNAVVSHVDGSGGDGVGIQADKDDDMIMTRARHREHIENTVDALQNFQMLAKQGVISADLAAEELRYAASELGRITGAVDVEDVLDVLFSDFCIGK